MNRPQPIGVGLLGLGVVGGGVARALICKKDWLATRIGAPLELRKALVRDPSKPRDPLFPSGLLTSNPADVLEDPAIQVVVELMGGEEPAAGYIRTALERGKDVVTANKEVMAKMGPSLLAAAEGSGRSLLFEGAVGGGIPIIGPLMKDLLANRIHSVHAIINGTTNFILSNMEDHGIDGAAALKLAQELGYAEADPTNDVEGIDAAYKLAILATLAFHSWVHPDQIFREGISRLDARDFRYANELGYSIKLLAIARQQGQGIEARVHPALIPQGHVLAKVGGAFNAVEVEGDLAGRTVFHGQGAGREPTTSAVVGNLVELGRWIACGGRPLVIIPPDGTLEVLPMTELETSYYYRLTAPDRAGVLAQIARVLGGLNISIASVIQKDTDSQRQTAELVITTHPAKEAAVRESVALLTGLDVVETVDNLIRVEELPA